MTDCEAPAAFVVFLLVHRAVAQNEQRLNTGGPQVQNLTAFFFGAGVVALPDNRVQPAATGLRRFSGSISKALAAPALARAILPLFE